MILPIASFLTSIPATRIHDATRSFAFRIAGEQNIRVSFLSSSLTFPSASIRSITVRASWVTVLPADATTAFWDLKFGIWSFFGVWSLRFGVFRFNFHDKCYRPTASTTTAHDKRHSDPQCQIAPAHDQENAPALAILPFRRNNHQQRIRVRIVPLSFPPPRATVDLCDRPSL